MGVVNALTDPDSTLRRYPMSLDRYGLNPFGDPLWRIVFAASRMMLVGGEWPDGAIEYRWRPTYRHITDQCYCGHGCAIGACKEAPVWVLERWMSGRDFTGGQSERQWDLMYRQPCGLLLKGPYPSRGDYQWAHTFTCAVADANLDWLISVIEKARTKTWQDNLDACRADYEADTASRRSRMDAIIRNALPAFLDRAMVGAGGHGRGTKTAPILKTAEELRLPKEPGKFINLRSRNGNASRS
jgi:hypothetical protein